MFTYTTLLFNPFNHINNKIVYRLSKKILYVRYNKGTHNPFTDSQNKNDKNINNNKHHTHTISYFTPLTLYTYTVYNIHCTLVQYIV